MPNCLTNILYYQNGDVDPRSLIAAHAIAQFSSILAIAERIYRCKESHSDCDGI